MKITYKYSRNNAQFLYDLSSTSSIDQLVRRLTGRQTVTNKDGEKEHVDPAFSVDEILINGVEVFSQTEDEAVYSNIDKLRAPWDDTENKELSAEDARKRNEDLTKAASLLKAYNDRFVELEKLLSLLPAEVRKIPNEFMSIDVNGFYRTISISLGLNKYLDEISTDKEAFKIFNTAEEQNNALNNVMDVIDFLSNLDESAEELFKSEDQEDVPTDDLKEAPNGEQQDVTEEAPNGEQQDAPIEGQQDASTDDTVEGDKDASTDDTVEDDKETPAEGKQEASTDNAAEGDKETPTEGKQDASTDNDVEGDKETPTEGKQEASADNDVEGDKEASTDNAKESSNSDQQDEPAAGQGQQDTDKPKLTGTAAIDDEFSKNINKLFGEND